MDISLLWPYACMRTHSTEMTLQRQQCFLKSESDTRTVFSARLWCISMCRCSTGRRILGQMLFTYCSYSNRKSVCADVCGCVGLTRQSEQARAPTDVQSLVPVIIIITRCDRIHVKMRQVLLFTAVFVCFSVNMCRGMSACCLCTHWRGSSCT